MAGMIFLVDMNSFFASVEQVINPRLMGKPIVVCGRGRTVVTTASYEARAYGVKTGMNLYEARLCCPHVIPVEGDLNRYIDTGRRIHKILLDFTDLVEVFSIDECFLDVKGICNNEQDARKTALEIKKRIKDELKLLCSIGIGPNKVVAKLASKMQKPDGLVYIAENDIPGLFAKIPVEKMQGIGVGRQIAGKLRNIGINTAGDLGNASIDKLMHHFGILGWHLKRLGQGKDENPVKKYLEYEQIKSVGHSHTFPKDTWSKDIIYSYLMVQTQKVGKRLREYKLMGKTVNVYIRFSDFSSYGMQSALKQYIRHNHEIYCAARKIVQRTFPLSKAVRLIGVTISDLKRDDNQQFLLEEMDKQVKLTDTVDEINAKYGAFTVKPVSVLMSEKYGIRPVCGILSKQLLWTKD